MQNLQQLYIELVNDNTFSEVCILNIYFGCIALWMTIRLTLMRPAYHIIYNLTTGNYIHICMYIHSCVVLTHLCINMYAYTQVYANVCTIMYIIKCNAYMSTMVCVKGISTSQNKYGSRSRLIYGQLNPSMMQLTSYIVNLIAK